MRAVETPPENISLSTRLTLRMSRLPALAPTSTLWLQSIWRIPSRIRASLTPNDTYDWGITLVPERLMSQWLIVGWAPGDDPTYDGTAPEISAPIWLTGGHPSASATPNDAYDVCIDDGGNGGSSQISLTGKTYDRKISGIAPRAIENLQRRQRGRRAGPERHADLGLRTGEWRAEQRCHYHRRLGRGPLDSSGGKPAMDMGDTIRNLRAWLPTKAAALQVDVNGNGLYDEGDTIRYTIQVRNIGASAIPAGTLKSQIPWIRIPPMLTVRRS